MSSETRKAKKKPIYKCLKCGELCIENVESNEAGHQFCVCPEVLIHKGCGGEVEEVTEKIQALDNSPTSDCFD